MYSIVIPSYNEKRLLDLIRKIKSMHDFILIIIDDGSIPPINFKFNQSQIFILRNEINRGKGYSILKGIKESSKKNCTYSIVLDADFQHDPQDIKFFINCSKRYDLIMGYRVFKRPMPVSRIISNKITSAIISLITGQKIKDSQCGFRMYKNSIFKNATFNEEGFQFESEILLKLGKNISIKQIPIKTIYNKDKSHINKTKDTFKFIKLIIRHLSYGK